MWMLMRVLTPTLTLMPTLTLTITLSLTINLKLTLTYPKYQQIIATVFIRVCRNIADAAVATVPSRRNPRNLFSSSVKDHTHHNLSRSY